MKFSVHIAGVSTAWTHPYNQDDSVQISYEISSYAKESTTKNLYFTRPSWRNKIKLELVTSREGQNWNRQPDSLKTEATISIPISIQSREFLFSHIWVYIHQNLHKTRAATYSYTCVIKTTWTGSNNKKTFHSDIAWLFR